MSRGLDDPGVPSRVGASPPDETHLMGFIVLTVTVAQLLDLGTFARMIRLNGAAAEANPLVAGVLLSHGLEFALVAKLAALSLIVAVIVVLADRGGRTGHPRLARTVATLAVLAGVLGGLTNALAMI
jgi:hypothetical protein